jgi:rod shape-determining protein MreD
MIVTWQVALRIGLVTVLAAVLQLAFFSNLSVLGGTPDLLPVVAVALGLLGGAVLGAVCGFALGLLVDSLLLETLGVSSLVLLTVGYLAGRWRESYEITSALVPPLLTGGLTLIGAFLFAALQLMLGVESPVSLLVLREILVKGLLGALLALPFYPLVRLALRPALVEDTPRRRGRTTFAPIRAA